VPRPLAYKECGAAGLTRLLPGERRFGVRCISRVVTPRLDTDPGLATAGPADVTIDFAGFKGVAMAANVGARFATALLAKDWDGVMALLDPAVDFRGVTPGQPWEAKTPDDLSTYPPARSWTVTALSTASGSAIPTAITSASRRPITTPPPIRSPS
jgi:hypothetical protein